MESLLNFEEIAVFLSIAGILCFAKSFRVGVSPPWDASRGATRTLLALVGLALQRPVVLVAVYQPPYVTVALSVEGFSYTRLATGYLPQGLLFAAVGWLVRWLRA